MRLIQAMWSENGVVKYRDAVGNVETIGEVPFALSSRFTVSGGDIPLTQPTNEGEWYTVFTSRPDKYDRVYPREFGAFLLNEDLAYMPSPVLNYIDLETTELFGRVELVAAGTDSFSSGFSSCGVGDRVEEDIDSINGVEGWVVGYNLFNYDLQVLRQHYGYCLGIHGFSKQPFRYGGDVKEVDVPDGDREYIDLYLQTLRWDVENGGKLTSFGLKDVVEQMGLRTRQGVKEWTEAHLDYETYLNYAIEDIYDTIALGAKLIPTLLAQTQILPCRLTHIGVMGAGQKVDALLVGTSIKAGYAVPKRRKDDSEVEGALVEAHPGAYTGCILKADFTSMYPSIIVNENLQPNGDVLGIYPKWMRLLREQRVALKQTNPTLSAALKILVNSFYGYTGANFPFSDKRIANAITAKGRELVAKLRDLLMEYGEHLNTDTDGVLVRLHDPALLSEVEQRVAEALAPYQVEFEVYDAALIIKKKNYILAKDGKIKVVKGNSLRNRSDEPFLQDFIQEILMEQLDGVPLTEDDLWVKITHLMGRLSPQNAYQRKRVGKFVRQHRSELAEGFEDGVKIDMVKTPDGWKLKDEAEELDLPYYLQRIIGAVGRFGGWMEEWSKRYNKKTLLQEELDRRGIDIAITAKRRKHAKSVLEVG
ncbi:MAG: DNA polymerase domain-containing protein [Candidatus Caldarchaeum sp.]